MICTNAPMHVVQLQPGRRLVDLLHLLDVPAVDGGEDARTRAGAVGKAHQQESGYRVGGIAAR